MTRMANVAIAGCLGAALFAALHRPSAERCEASGGKWASASGVCVTRDCLAWGSCGKWAYPASRCAQVKVGAERAEVWFQLGEPDEVRADEARWHAGKDSAEIITARFQVERLVSLSCPVE